MEGGLTRKRGYLVLVALLLVVLLALLIWRPKSQQVSDVAVLQIDSALLAQLEDSDTLRFRKYNRRERMAWDESKDRRSAVSNYHTYSNARRSTLDKPIDLNRSDSIELQRLWGIGPVLSRRIVNYRTLLGGFVSKEQLREVYGLADSVYDRIAPLLTVDTSLVNKIDINSASRNQLRRHPYLDKYQADAIVRLREKQGLYHSVEDLRQVSIIEQEIYNKITPYLSCNLQPKK